VHTAAISVARSLQERTRPGRQLSTVTDEVRQSR
jgi:hypothetical protein